MNNFFYNRCASSFDGFIEIITLKEGLITSYNISALQLKLAKIFINRIHITNPKAEELLDTKLDWNKYSFLLSIQDFNKNDEIQLKQLLNTYGYYISYKNPFLDFVRLTIEPKYPIVINDILKEKKTNYLYHITHNSNLKSIEKIGLAPRGSETRFDHPDDRIYLLIANDIQLKIFKSILARDKKRPIEEFITFKIPVNDKYKYYLDDTATSTAYDIIACFVLQNIPPTELIKI